MKLIQISTIIIWFAVIVVIFLSFFYPKTIIGIKTTIVVRVAASIALIFTIIYAIYLLK